MAALSEILAKFDIDTSGLKKGAKDGESAVDGIVGKLKTFGTMLAGGVVLNGIKNMVTGLVDQGSALNDASNQLGISTDALQQWGFAAKLNGVEAGELNKSFLVLQKGMAKAAQSGAQTGGPFQKLGVQLRDAGGNMRETTDVLRDTGLAIARMKSPAERTSAAMEVFGKAGAKLNPLFADGEEGLKKYLAEIDKLGGGISKDAIAGLDDMGDQMDRLDMVWLSAKSKIVSAFVPALTSMVGGLANTLGGLMKTKEGAAALQVGVGALAAAAAAAGLAMLAPWLPIITAITFVGALVQDFIVGLHGGDSAIGRIFDKLFGEGSGQTFFAEAKKDIEAVIASIKEAYQWLQKVTGGKGSTGDKISRVNNKVNREINEQLHDSAHKLLGTDSVLGKALEAASKSSPWIQEGLQQREYEKEARALIEENDVMTNNPRAFSRSWQSDSDQEFGNQSEDSRLLAQTIAELKAGNSPTFDKGGGGAGAAFGIGPATANVAPTTENNTQTNSIAITINADSDPDAIAGAASDSLGAQLRAAGANFRRTK